MNPFPSPAIIVHGGAGRIRDEELPQRLEGCEEAAVAGWKIIQEGRSALDAVECAVMALEDNPLFNAGTGSTLNSLGQVEMDAAIMEGYTLRAGAVAAVRGIKNPVQLARRVMDDGRHVVLAGDGALLFARQIGFPECPPDSLIVEHEKKRWEEKHGTVGCVALDSNGMIAWPHPPAEFLTNYRVESETRLYPAVELTRMSLAEFPAPGMAKRSFAS